MKKVDPPSETLRHNGLKKMEDVEVGVVVTALNGNCVFLTNEVIRILADRTD
jgi:hypothetical protein